MSDPNTPPIQTSGVSAAQGRTGTQTMKVLAVSILLVVVVFIGLYALLVRRTASHPGGGGQSGTDSHAASNAFHASPPASVPGPPPASTADQRAAPH